MKMNINDIKYLVNSTFYRKIFSIIQNCADIHSGLNITHSQGVAATQLKATCHPFFLNTQSANVKMVVADESC